jgi:hypothetical protein
MKLAVKKIFAVMILFSAASVFPFQVSAQTSFKTPQSAANALFYAAWRTKNKTKAGAVANNKAIEKLFSSNFISQRKFAGCTDQSETEKGLFTCVYEDPTDNLFNVAFETIKKGKSWRVRQVTFAAEN